MKNPPYPSELWQKLRRFIPPFLLLRKTVLTIISSALAALVYWAYDGLRDANWTGLGRASEEGAHPASSHPRVQKDAKKDVSNLVSEEEPVYSVGYPAGWNRITQKACPAGRLADFSFQLKDEFPVIESENLLVCFASGGPVVGKSHQLFKDCIYQFNSPTGVRITIKILDIDPIARLIKFACTSTK